MYLAGYTDDEIATALGQKNTGNFRETVKSVSEFTGLEKQTQLFANFQDSEFETPIYNVWSFAKKTNKVGTTPLAR